MGNRVISYSLRGFGVFLKVPLIIIIRFGENKVLGTIYIDIYKFRWWTGEGQVQGPSCSGFIIYKKGKIKKLIKLKNDKKISKIGHSYRDRRSWSHNFFTFSTI